MGNQYCHSWRTHQAFFTLDLRKETIIRHSQFIEVDVFIVHNQFRV